MTALKFCPICQYHFSTRSAFIVCSPCREVARRKAQLRPLAQAQRALVHKLQKNGYGRARAIEVARAGR